MSGTLGSTPIAGGRLRGDVLTFTAAGAKYRARVTGNRIEGTTGPGGTVWTATRAPR